MANKKHSSNLDHCKFAIPKEEEKRFQRNQTGASRKEQVTQITHPR